MTLIWFIMVQWNWNDLRFERFWFLSLIIDINERSSNEISNQKSPFWIQKKILVITWIVHRIKQIIIITESFMINIKFEILIWYHISDISDMISVISVHAAEKPGGSRSKTSRCGIFTVEGEYENAIGGQELDEELWAASGTRSGEKKISHWTFAACTKMRPKMKGWLVKILVSNHKSLCAFCAILTINYQQTMDHRITHQNLSGSEMPLELKFNDCDCDCDLWSGLFQSHLR